MPPYPGHLQALTQTALSWGYWRVASHCSWVSVFSLKVTELMIACHPSLNELQEGEEGPRTQMDLPLPQQGVSSPVAPSPPLSGAVGPLSLSEQFCGRTASPSRSNVRE